MAVNLQEISSLITKLAPKKLAADWDNVGLQLGAYNQEVSKVLVALDVNQDVIEEAIEKDIDLIVSHHPFIFSELKAVRFDTAIGNLIQNAIKNEIAIYSAHTNYDIASGGLNDFLADKLGLKNTSPLQVTTTEELKKIVVFVPQDSLDEVRKALGELGAGCLGNYSHCSFYQSGTGTFKPLHGSKPYKGEVGQVNQVEEYRLETIVKADDVNSVINKLEQVHPYEEVAYDIYAVENQGKKIGLGRIGYLDQQENLNDYLAQLKAELDLENVKFVGNSDEGINKVALCSGSGADFIKTAAGQGADLYITGDVKYHEAQLAEELGLNLIDAGHYGTEKIMREGMTDYLQEQITTDNLDVEIIKSKINTNPFQVK
ncbi:Nif3-like dinuclear metal center hexameric protein [Halanaerobacter jeridensis]|uniref:GTP cyclohydrolase 1 type 2 homolog n=1 Tax=Halanaerobacter jeridensis TaxID=706427 RepID=A0A938XRU1_9FIRM|nr:Nif3-like dinuclear metal center hexameric protein [Halanaerobacter jeridensis]MBM7556263.1 dinuclear metal center YbgI/SA1388 family protein [Halanaerobacter jeridensis]